MRASRVLTLTVVAVILALGGWSFYGSVLSPHRDGQAMEGMVMPGDAPAQPAPAGSGADAGHGPVPASVAGLPLTGLQSGDEAVIAVEQLHGKALGSGLAAAWVAQYGAGGQATLWVSRSVDPADAQALFVRMTDKIAEGTSPFTGSTPMAEPGVDGYQLDGMGQKHFYWVAGTDLFWLAASPEKAQAALSDVLDGVAASSAGEGD